MNLSITVQIKPTLPPSIQRSWAGRRSAPTLQPQLLWTQFAKLTADVSQIEIAGVRPLNGVSWLNSGLKRPGLVVKPRNLSLTLPFIFAPRQSHIIVFVSFRLLISFYDVQYFGTKGFPFTAAKSRIYGGGGATHRGLKSLYNGCKHMSSPPPPPPAL